MICRLKDQISRDMDRYSPEPIRKPGSTNQQAGTESSSAENKNYLADGQLQED